MASPLPAIASLLAGAGLLTIANALLGSLVGVRMAVEGFPRPLAGLVMSAYFAGFIGGSLKAPAMIGRVGHIRAFAACAAMLGAAAMGHALWVGPVAWIVLRAIVGFAMAGQLMITESWLSALAAGPRRARVFSSYMVAIYLAFGLGQFGLSLGDPAGLDLFVLISLILALSILPIVLTTAHAPLLTAPPRLRFGRLFAVAPLALAGAFTAGLAVGSVQSLGPQFASDIGLPITRIAMFMGVFFLSGLLLQWPAGHLSDVIDRRRVLGGMALAAALACGALAFVHPRSDTILLVLAALGGGTVATIYPLSVAHANDQLQHERVIPITAALLLANGVGAVVGPIVASVMMVAIGPAGLFHTAALPCAALAGYAVYRASTYDKGAQEQFTAVAQTTPVVAELDPRAE